MHICYLCNEYPPAPHGGLGSMTRLLATGLADLGHQVTVVGLYPRSEEMDTVQEGVRVLRLRSSAVPKSGVLVNGPRLRSALVAIHRADSVDVIEGHEPDLSLLNGRSPGTRVIRMSGGHRFFATTLGKKPAPWRSYLESRSFALADALCGVSRFVVEETSRLLNLDKTTIEILPNPVNTRWFSQSDSNEVPGRIMFFGTFVEKKGLRQLVQAFPRIRQVVPEAHIVAVGKETFDSRGNAFSEQALAEIDAESATKVTFTEHVAHEELPKILGTASVVACPSHMEAFGMVWAEAMALGKAVVGSKSGPGPEVILDGSTGLLCDPYDPSDIADVITRLLLDPNLRAELGRAGRQRAESEFSLEVVLPMNVSFYQRAIGKKVSD